MTQRFCIIHLLLIAITHFSACAKLTSLGSQYYGSDVTSDTLTWIFADGAGTNGINRDTGQGAGLPQTAVFNGKLYAIWAESNTSRTQTRVAVYNGSDASPAWAFVDGGSPANGINYNSGQNVDAPQLIVFNSKLYAAWSENSTNSNNSAQARVAVYNGNDAAPAWSFVDVNGANGLNFNSLKDGTNPRMAVYSNALYITWTENNSGVTQIHVYRYNGNDTTPAWTAVDNPVASATGINKNAILDASNSVLITFNSKLYALWVESNGSKDQLRAAVYPGSPSSWATSFVDGNGTNGLNRDPGRHAANAEPCVLNNKLYVTWREYNAVANQIRLAVYNGNDAAPAWSFVDGAGASGLNRDTSKATDSPHCAVYNSRLYLAWQETNSAAVNQVRVAVYNGNDNSPSVRFADGGGDKGINKDVTLDAQTPRLNAFNSGLFATWSANNTVPRKQIRVASGL